MTKQGMTTIEIKGNDLPEHLQGRPMHYILNDIEGLLDAEAGVFAKARPNGKGVRIVFATTFVRDVANTLYEYGYI